MFAPFPGANAALVLVFVAHVPPGVGVVPSLRGVSSAALLALAPALSVSAPPPLLSALAPAPRPPALSALALAPPALSALVPSLRGVSSASPRRRAAATASAPRVGPAPRSPIIPICFVALPFLFPRHVRVPRRARGLRGRGRSKPQAALARASQNGYGMTVMLLRMVLIAGDGAVDDTCDGLQRWHDHSMWSMRSYD